jgi:hypothetical protein
LFDQIAFLDQDLADHTSLSRLHDLDIGLGYEPAVSDGDNVELRDRSPDDQLPDGVYRRAGDGGLRFVPVSVPGPEELSALVRTLAERIGRSLERSGLITRDIENAYLAFDPAEEAPIHGLLGHSITYRIATGPREGQKVFMLQTLPAEREDSRPEVAASSGFSLHAGVLAKVSEGEKLEHLTRYVSRPPVACERLALTEHGQVRYTLKTPYRDGTTHVMFEPEDFMARLAALVPKPRAHLIRYHGVFAPASAWRAAVVPSGRGRGKRGGTESAGTEKTETDRHRALTWAMRLKRVFAIEIGRCQGCGGTLEVIASIEEADVIDRILGHLGGGPVPADGFDPSPPGRGPPPGMVLI